jgi:hypothetical protein
MDVVKVDRDVAYVVTVVHICCKSLSPMFHLFFSRMLQACLFGRCICFHTHNASILSGCCVCFSNVFACVLDVCFKCFIYLFLYVASVASKCFKSRSGVTHRIRMGSWRGHERSPWATFGSMGPHMAVRQRRRRAMSGRRRPMRGRGKWTTAAGVRTWVSVRTVYVL